MSENMAYNMKRDFKKISKEQVLDSIYKNLCNLTNKGQMRQL